MKTRHILQTATYLQDVMTQITYIIPLTILQGQFQKYIQLQKYIQIIPVLMNTIVLVQHLMTKMTQFIATQRLY